VAELSADGFYGENADQGGSFWIVAGAFAGTVKLLNCLCGCWTLELLAICSLLPPANE
jgi:hypothetical protein